MKHTVTDLDFLCVIGLLFKVLEAIPSRYCTNCSRPLETTMSEEKKLIKHLLDNYKEVGKGGRPVLNITTVMEVQFGLGLIQMDLDERYKVLKMSMWSRYKWRDEYLQWDPSEYSGVKNVRVPSERIWLPDIMLYNSADPQSEFRDVLAVVMYDGSVSWVPHQIFKSSCSLDVTNFPFDNQNCHMWFGSWTHTRAEVDVKMAFESGIDLSTFQSDYLESSDWNIQNTTAEKKIMPPGANDTASTYAVLTFEINMKRKLVFSSYILTLPCVFLACLTLVVFWLPPDRPDRTALAMSIFASFLVLLLILVEAAPPTASSVPVLGVYYCFNLVIIMVAVFLSALVVNVCRAGETKRKVPRWLKKLCIDWIGRVLFVPTMSQETADMASVFRNEGMQLDATPQQETRILDYTPEKLVRVAAQCNGTYKSTVEPSENTRLVEGQMKEMRKSLAHIKSNMVEKAVTEYNNSQCIKEWRDVSLVMDRVFFIVYIILIVVSLITLFPRPGR